MKKIILAVVLCGISFLASAQIASAQSASTQSASVEKTMFGVQTGFLGIWAYNETKRSKSVTIRSEVGFDGGIFGGSLHDNTGFILTPVISIEPRRYYNLKRRLKQSKRIDGNSGNFYSIKASYNPDWFVLSNQDNLNVNHQISITPTWAMRRNIRNYFNYETGIGIGYRHHYSSQYGSRGEANINLHLRIGYRIK